MSGDVEWTHEAEAAWLHELQRAEQRLREVICRAGGVVCFDGRGRLNPAMPDDKWSSAQPAYTVYLLAWERYWTLYDARPSNARGDA